MSVFSKQAKSLESSKTGALFLSKIHLKYTKRILTTIAIIYASIFKLS